jgi:hypothetical protein
MVCRGRQKRFLQPHHHDAVAALLDYGFHVSGADRDRLLHPDVEAGVQRLAGELRVQPRRDAQEHGVQLLVAIHLGGAGVAGLHAILGRGPPRQFQVPIAQRREPHRQIVQRGQDIAIGVRAYAHHGDVQAPLEFTLIAHQSPCRSRGA